MKLTEKKSDKPLVVVTGGAGYIGSHTIVELLEAGNKVVSIDNHINSDPGIYQEISKMIPDCDLEWCFHDLSTYSGLKNILNRLGSEKIDSVIHFAALKSVNDSCIYPLDYYQNNLMSMIHVLHTCTSLNIKNLVFSSSCSVYGNVDSLPVSDDTQFGKAQSPYAETKQMCEQMIESFSKTMPGFSYINLRYFNPIGAHSSGLIGEIPKGRPNNLVPILMEKILKGQIIDVFKSPTETKDGTCVRDYVHVSDLAEAHVSALDFLRTSESPYRDAFNLGTGKGTSTLELVKEFENVIGRDVVYKMSEPREGDVGEIWADPSKAKRVLGWVPKRTLKESLDSAWKWFLSLNKIERT